MLALDEAAFGEFYRQTAPGLRALLRRCSEDAALADDILQEAYYRLLRARLPRGGPPELKAYVYRIATSLLADHFRRCGRERRYAQQFVVGRPDAAAPPSRPGSDTMKLFAELRPREQSLLWLAYVEGCNHREIASSLGLHPASIKVLLFRARRKFARALSAAGLEGELAHENR